MAVKKVSDLQKDYSDAVSPFEWMIAIIGVLLALGACLWMNIF